MVIENASRCRENAGQSDRPLESGILILNIRHVYSESILMPFSGRLETRNPVSGVMIDNMWKIISNIIAVFCDYVGVGDAQIEVPLRSEPIASGASTPIWSATACHQAKPVPPAALKVGVNLPGT